MVDIGDSDPLQIVCGAPNVESGQKVVVAIPGTTLIPSSGESINIKTSKIRGIESNGMICSEEELGLGTDHDGILVLPDNAEIGSTASSYYNVESDIQFEIGLTPNRADGMSHIGVARDLLCALKHQKLVDENQSVKWPSIDSFKVDSRTVEMDISVVDHAVCPRYAGVTISDIKVGPSPDWLQKRLKSIDLKPINNVVDATNFVLHELGQPLHAFDLSKIKGNKVDVKTLSSKTKFITLDETDRVLDKNDLMICNGNEAMCIAGVFGGLDHGVSEKTKAIFLESAYFDPVSIRKSAKRHGLNTDASYRFERGINPDTVVYALKRAALLIQEIAGGNISSNITDLYPNRIEDSATQIDLEKLYSVSGAVMDPAAVKNILNWLDIKIISEDGSNWELSVPAYRVDVKREIDVIEEILRIYGFNNIPVPDKINASLSYGSKPNREKLQNIVSEMLSNNGFSEIMANSLTKGEYVNSASAKHLSAEQNVIMLNPLSSDLSALRQSLIFSGLESIAYNLNRRESNLKIYEFGKVYFKKGDRFEETSCLSVLMTGMKDEERWNTEQQDVGYYSIMGAVSGIMNRLGIFENHQLAETKNELFIEGSELTIEGRKVADVGKLRTDISGNMGIKQAVFCAEINWDIVLESLHINKVKFRPMTKYPSVRRDFSLLLDTEVNFSEIVDIAKETEKTLLKEVGLFDVYEGKDLGSGKKSYAVKFLLQDEEGTLNENRIEVAMNNILLQLEKQLGASLR
jgi:phenylalanyl-tRNA synthetase beta chain